MRGSKLVILAALACVLPTALASDKLSGTTKLQDFQPVGTTDKHHKHQQYDFTFVAYGTQYTCRTPEKEKLKATDFPVGGEVAYEINKTKGKVRGLAGHEEACTIVRVQQLAQQ